MTQAVINEFIDFMTERGAAPANASDILADDKMRYINCDGDKRGSKKIKYVLKIADGCGIGGFIHYREGEWHTFVSSQPKKNGQTKRGKHGVGAWSVKKPKGKQPLSVSGL